MDGSAKLRQVELYQYKHGYRLRYGGNARVKPLEGSGMTRRVLVLP